MINFSGIEIGVSRELHEFLGRVTWLNGDMEMLTEECGATDEIIGEMAQLGLIYLNPGTGKLHFTECGKQILQIIYETIF